MFTLKGIINIILNKLIDILKIAQYWFLMVNINTYNSQKQKSFGSSIIFESV